MARLYELEQENRKIDMDQRKAQEEKEKEINKKREKVLEMKNEASKVGSVN